jgi:hypothetical protein
MKNWKLIAEASQLRIPAPDLDRITPALDTLEAAFRPLLKTIPDDVEPAIAFYLFPESAK